VPKLYISAVFPNIAIADVNLERKKFKKNMLESIQLKKLSYSPDCQGRTKRPKINLSVSHQKFGRRLLSALETAVEDADADGNEQHGAKHCIVLPAEAIFIKRTLGALVHGWFWFKIHLLVK